MDVPFEVEEIKVLSTKLDHFTSCLDEHTIRHAIHIIKRYLLISGGPLYVRRWMVNQSVVRSKTVAIRTVSAHWFGGCTPM
jgi:hypothetical protein